MESSRCSYSQIDAFHKKITLVGPKPSEWYEITPFLWNVLKKSTKEKNTKQISTVDFSTLYTKRAVII